MLPHFFILMKYSRMLARCPGEEFRPLHIQEAGSSDISSEGKETYEVLTTSVNTSWTASCLP
jgi:hypothetical protein